MLVGIVWEYQPVKQASGSNPNNINQLLCAGFCNNKLNNNDTNSRKR